MANENEEFTGAGGPAVQVDDTAKMLEDAMAMGGIESVEITGKMAPAKGAPAKGGNADEGADPGEAGEENQGGETQTATGKKKTEKSEADPDDEEDEDEEENEDKTGKKKSVFFAKNEGKGKGGKGGGKIVINSAEDFINALAKEGLLDPKKPESYAKAFNNTRQWRAAQVEAQKLRTTVDDINRGWDRMPVSLLTGIGAWSKGDPRWMESMQSVPTLDFNVPVAEQDALKLIGIYVPGVTVTKEQVENDDPVAKNALTLAVAAFNKQSQEIKDAKANFTKQSQERSRALRESADQSSKALADAFPGMEDNSINAVKSLMLGGPEKLLERLYDNRSGAWKPESARQIAMLMYGEDEITSRDSTIRESEGKIHNIIDRGEKQIRQRGSGKRNTDANVAEVLSMVPQGGKSPYDSRPQK